MQRQERIAHQDADADRERLDATPPDSPGVRAQDLIVQTTAEIVSEGRAAAFWSARKEAVAVRSAPRHRVRTATQMTHADPTDPLAKALKPPTHAVARAYVPRDDARPRGATFGILVHQTLATIELAAAPTNIRDVAKVAARLLPVTDADIDAAVEVVRRTTKSDVWATLIAAEERGDLRREVPLEAVLDDGEIVEGVIDAAYLEDGEWTVVDYKTDRPEIGSPRLAGYEAQVSLYADILERATGQRAKALLLFV